MSGLFGGGGGGGISKPKEDPAMAEARRKADAEARRRRMGRGSLWLTGPTGLTGDPMLGRPTLLGG